jgi:hypothetical protein
MMTAIDSILDASESNHNKSQQIGWKGFRFTSFMRTFVRPKTWKTLPSSIDSLLNLSARVSKLEDQISSFPACGLFERIEFQERALANLGLETEKLKKLLASFTKSESPKSTPTPAPSPRPEKLMKELDFALPQPESLEGIISFLTERHGGQVHEKGIVTITSKSTFREGENPEFGPSRVADLTSDSYFWSKNEPGQWICWDFHEMRARPTHYAIRGEALKSWIVEGSLDGENWTKIDRQTDNQDFKEHWNTVSFTVSKPVKSRFIRLTQTDKRHDGIDYLFLLAVEFFGTLSE